MTSEKWARRLFLIGAWVTVACGAFHMVGHIMGMNLKPENDTERQLFGLMTTYHMPGSGRTPQELLNGFSLTFTILPIAIGTICLLVARSSDNALRNRVAMVAAIAMTAESAVSITYWFAGPTTFLVVSALAFSGSWIAASDGRSG